MKMALSNHCQRAFTLMEILIASIIMATVLLAIHGVFLGALRMRERTVDALERTLPREEALQTIQRDLSNLIASTNGALIGPLQSINQTNQLPGQIGPDFYTTGGELDGLVPFCNIEKIDYLLTAATNSGGPGRELVRAVTHNLVPASGQPQPEEKRTILSGVQSLTFLYYDGTQWDTAWDTTQQTNLPFAIKVQIRLMPEPGASGVIVQPLELVVPISVMLSTNPVVAVQ